MGSKIERPNTAVYVYGASQYAHRSTPKTVIRIEELLTDQLMKTLFKDVDKQDPEWTLAHKAFYLSQAEQLHTALLASLPGGTYDALFAIMANQKASILRVPSQG